MKKQLLIFLTSVLIANFTFADNEKYDGDTVSGQDFSGTSHRNSSWVGTTAVGTTFSVRGYSTDYTDADFTRATLTDASFEWANLTNAIFEDAIITGVNFGGTIPTGYESMGTQILYSTASYKNKDLTGVSFRDCSLSGFNFAGQNLTNANFIDTYTSSNIDFNRANLTNATFAGASIQYSDFTGANLSNAVFYDYSSGGGSSFRDCDFTNSDFRGAIVDGSGVLSDSTCIYKNTILSDGTTTNFSMTSSADNLTILEYVPATIGGAMISAKFTENASLSGDSTLTLEKGAQVEVVNNSMLTFGNQSSLFINTDANSSTMITIADGAGISFDDGSKITINLVTDDSTFNVDGVSFSIMSWVQDNLRVQGLENFKENENVFLTINDVSYNDVWDFYVTESQAVIKVGSAVPEPAEWAIIFGAVALVFVVYRRRK